MRRRRWVGGRRTSNEARASWWCWTGRPATVRSRRDFLLWRVPPSASRRASETSPRPGRTRPSWWSAPSPRGPSGPWLRSWPSWIPDRPAEGTCPACRYTAGGQTMRILIADDDPDILRLIKVNLDYLGHTVLETSDGEHAIQVAAQERPDLIVRDVIIPYRHGLSILREPILVPDTLDLPLTLLTPKAIVDEQQRGWAAGATEYLVKPFTPHDLASA